MTTIPRVTEAEMEEWEPKTLIPDPRPDSILSRLIASLRTARRLLKRLEMVHNADESGAAFICPDCLAETHATPTSPTGGKRPKRGRHFDRCRLAAEIADVPEEE